MGERLKQKASRILEYGRKHQALVEEPQIREKAPPVVTKTEENIPESYTPRGLSIDCQTQSPLFDIRKSVYLFDQLVELHGFKKAKQLAVEIFTKDIYSIVWEVAKPEKSLETGYTLIEGSGEIKLVHDSDLYLNNKDILEGVTDYRRGGERFQTGLFKSTVQRLEENETLYWISPKRAEYETQDECVYEDSIINIAERRGNNIRLRQFITKLIGAEQSADFLNQLGQSFIIESSSHVDKVLRTIGKTEGVISDRAVWEAVERTVGRELGFESASLNFEELEQEVVKDCQRGAERFLEGILGAKSAVYLESLYFDVITGVLRREKVQTHFNFDYSVLSSSIEGGGGISFSCGTIGGGKNGGGVITSSEDGGGSEGKGIKCKGCGEVNTCNKDVCYKCRSPLG